MSGDIVEKPKKEKRAAVAPCFFSAVEFDSFISSEQKNLLGEAKSEEKVKISTKKKPVQLKSGTPVKIMDWGRGKLVKFVSLLDESVK